MDYLRRGPKTSRDSSCLSKPGTSKYDKNKYRIREMDH
jgi:hypothetical protein